MDRNGRPRDWTPDWLDHDRKTRFGAGKPTTNKDFLSMQHRPPPRWDRPENWYRKAPK